MKSTFIAIIGLLSVAAAAPVGTSFTKRQSIESITDTLLFSNTIDQFEAARNAQNPSDLDWSSDDCSYSPDNPLGFNFVPSCHRHDFGYRNYKAQGRFDAGKASIDDNFHSDLYNQCAQESETAICEGVADIYYEAVKAFGKKRAVEAAL